MVPFLRLLCLTELWEYYGLYVAVEVEVYVVELSRRVANCFAVYP